MSDSYRMDRKLALRIAKKWGVGKLKHLGNNMVLKLTAEPADAQKFLKIKDNLDTHLPEVYDVFKFN